VSKSKIEWTDRVWNPVTGCTKISPGCQNCYAERMAKRLAGRCGYPADGPFKVTLHPERLEQPFRWREPSKIFVCSMGDLFHEDVPFDYIDRVFSVMYVSPEHTFMVLTKRPERMKEYFNTRPRDSMKQERVLVIDEMGASNYSVSLPLRNVWLGVTAENQEQADKRIPVLLQIPAAVRFVSVEPMLGPVDLTELPIPYEICNRGFNFNALTDQDDEHFYNDHPKIDWVICGGESGPGARPMHPDWTRSLRDHCQAAGVPFFFKQWGEWETFYDRDNDDPDWCNVPEDGPGIKRINLAGGYGFHGDRVIYLRRVGKKKAGRLLDGIEHNGMPGVAI